MALRSSITPSSSSQTDPWASRYLSGGVASVDDNATSPSSSTKQTKAKPSKLGSDYGLGVVMPSRISRDLSSSLNSTTQPERGRQQLSSTRFDSIGNIARDCSPNQGDYSAPIVKTSDGGLSKVCGSLVEPSESRNKWACHGCHTVFARDATIYAAPSSASGKVELSDQSPFFCRPCYSSRFSLGTCNGCQKPVLGSTKEDGKFVKASSGLWHGKCWKCSFCEKGSLDGVEILVGMDGNPCCDGCFGKPKPARNVSTDVKAGHPSFRSTSASAASDTNGPNRFLPANRGAMGATIAELSKRFNQKTNTTSNRPLTPTSPIHPTSPNFATAAAANSRPWARNSTTNGSSYNVYKSTALGGFGVPSQLTRSPSRSSNHGSTMSRSNSITGSPPKPRPLTAQFTGDLNLAAFRTSFGTLQDTNGSGHLSRKDSRSRSYSPTKRNSPFESRDSLSTNSLSKSSSDGVTQAIDSLSISQQSAKVPGSPNNQPIGSSGGGGNMESRRNPLLDASREKMSSGFPRPLNIKTQEPIQDDKMTKEVDVDGQHDDCKPCIVCQKLPFQLDTLEKGTKEVVMVTLSCGSTLHADCFRCTICSNKIDATLPFSRLDPCLTDGLDGFAHPQCSPTIRIQQRVSTVTPDSTKSSGRMYKHSLSTDYGHVTHQRQLQPSLTTSSPPTPTSTPNFTIQHHRLLSSTTPNNNNNYNEKSATLLTKSPSSSSSNPAIGFFSTSSSSSSGSSTRPKLGGKITCVYCQLSVSPFDSVYGPRNTVWHKHCLVCRFTPSSSFKTTTKVCGKKLDSGAKVNQVGQVRCRNCFDKESSLFTLVS